MAAAAASMPKKAENTWSSVKKKEKRKGKMTKGKKERKMVEPMRRQQHTEPWHPVFNRYELRAPLIKSNNPYQLLNKYSANAWHAVQASDRWRRLHKKQAENKAEAKAEAARQEEMKKNDEAREASETLAAEIAELELASGMEVDPTET